MDPLARLLGEGREAAGDGLWLHKANAAAYLRAYAARQAVTDEDGPDANLRFIAELVAGGLRDDDGALLLGDGAEALERLPVAFLIEHAETVSALNGMDEDDLEGKSETTP